MPELPSARILLGTGDGAAYGYSRPVSVYAVVELRRQSTFGRPPRDQQTTDHRTVVDPLELSLTFEILSPTGVDIGGGAKGADGLAAVTDRSVDPETWERVERCLPWHLNGMSAACDHQAVEYETDPYGRRRPSLTLTEPCPDTGYRYGSAWLVRELPVSIVRDVETLARVFGDLKPEPFADLVAELGITAKVQRAAGHTRAGWPADARHWTVTLTRPPAQHDGRTSPPAVRLPFSQGSAHTEPPTTGEVMECLASDCAMLESAPTLREWIAELGYDEDDEPKARRDLAAVSEQARQLREFLGDDGYATLTGKDA